MAKLVRLDDGTAAITLSETELEALAEGPREIEPPAARHGGGQPERGDRVLPDRSASKLDSSGALRAVREVVATAAGATALAYVAGATLVVARLEARNLPAIAVIGTVPREAILAVGASQALAPAIVVMAAHAFWSTIERDALSDLRRRQADARGVQRGSLGRRAHKWRARWLSPHENRFGDLRYQIVAVGLWLVLLGL